MAHQKSQMRNISTLIPLMNPTHSFFAWKLTACGLKELVVQTWAEYKDLAVKLAMDDQTLLAHRLNLEMGRETCDLFNTQQWVYNLEHGILQIVHGYEKGHPNENLLCDFTYKRSRRPSLN